MLPVKGQITACGFVTLLRFQNQVLLPVKGQITACGFVTIKDSAVKDMAKQGERPDYRLRYIKKDLKSVFLRASGLFVWAKNTFQRLRPIPYSSIQLSILYSSPSTCQPSALSSSQCAMLLR